MSTETQIDDLTLSLSLKETFIKSDSESLKDYELRVDEFLSQVIVDHGVTQLVRVIKTTKFGLPSELMSLVLVRITSACLRYRGDFDGKSYEARFMGIPFVARANHPREFPVDIDNLTLLHINRFVGRVVSQKCKDQKGIIVLPLNKAITCTELSEGKPSFFVNVLKSLFENISQKNTSNIGKFISPDFENHKNNKIDNELIELGSDRFKIKGMDKKVSGLDPKKTPISDLKAGAWLGFRIIPVVVLYPRGIEVNGITGFGPQSDLFGSILSFSSGKSKNSETTTCKVRPIGIYDIPLCASYGRIEVVKEKCISDIVNLQHFFNQDSFEVEFSNDPIKSELTITLSDGNSDHSFTLKMLRGFSNHQFIEVLSTDLNDFGIKTKVDHGDNMMRFSNASSLSLH